MLDIHTTYILYVTNTYPYLNGYNMLATNPALTSGNKCYMFLSSMSFTVTMQHVIDKEKHAFGTESMDGARVDKEWWGFGTKKKWHGSSKGRIYSEFVAMQLNA
eukprot:10317838-Ditylum_brightwellii.AAC.1